MSIDYVVGLEPEMPNFEDLPDRAKSNFVMGFFDVDTTTAQEIFGDEDCVKIVGEAYKLAISFLSERDHGERGGLASDLREKAEELGKRLDEMSGGAGFYGGRYI